MNGPRKMKERPLVAALEYGVFLPLNLVWIFWLSPAGLAMFLPMAIYIGYCGGKAVGYTRGLDDGDSIRKNVWERANPWR